MRELLIIGIDGADWEYVRRRLTEGDLPALARIAHEGGFGPLNSTVPPLSSPAWPTMTTGMAPGSLGIFDLTVPDGYGKRVVSGADVQLPRLWDYVGSSGGRSVVMNVPVTYPPAPIEGVMVSGLLSPEDGAWAHPPGLAGDLRERFGYSPEHAPDRRGKLKAVRRRRRVFLHLLEREDWNVAMVVFSATDWAQHDHWEDRAFIDRLFTEVDRAVAQIVRRAGAENVAVLSDHGFTGAGKVLNVNRLLNRHRLLEYGGSDGKSAYAPNLELKKGPDSGPGRRLIERFFDPSRMLKVMHRFGLERVLDFLPSRLWYMLKDRLPVWKTPVDWSSTRAYLYNGLPQTVRVNLAGREPQGIVPPREYDAVCEAVTSALRDARDPEHGEPIFTRVLRRQEAWPGCEDERAPDIIFEVRDDDYLVSPADHPEAVWGTGRARGRHRSTGVYLLDGPAFRPTSGARAELLDMTPTLLAAAGCPVPRGLDGRADPNLLMREPELAPTEDNESAAVGAAEATADCGDVRRRLQHLGYI